MTFEFVERIANIGSDAWNALAGTAYPFLRYEYLHALEASRSVGGRTGWRPCHLVARDEQGLAGLLPLYEKSHSWGEYVFDWSWAEAYERSGLTYYPKLLSAIPFTPCEGPRLLLRADRKPVLAGQMLHAVQARVREQGFSSWHLLFPDADGQALLEGLPLVKRLGVQFHWRNPGCATFDELLARFASRKRKNVRKERANVQAQGIGFRWFEGAEVTEALLDQFYLFYQATYLKHGQRGYLTRDFFARLLASMPEQVMLVQAERAGKPVAAAWFLKSETTLYGRYWGCLEEYDHLHFETCYYQGIDYCLAQGLMDFDAGAQGEHKLLRGFSPRLTCSYHWLADARFGPAIAEFLRQERTHVQAYLAEAETLLPYRRDQDAGAGS